jgi:hypothetical protein
MTHLGLKFCPNNPNCTGGGWHEVMKQGGPMMLPCPLAEDYPDTPGGMEAQPDGSVRFEDASPAESEMDAIAALPDFTSGIEIDDKMRVVQLTERLKWSDEQLKRAGAESSHYMQHMLAGTICTHDIRMIWDGVSHETGDR